MIGLKASIEFLNLLNCIPYLEDEHPIGMFIVAPPGSGKSFLLTNYISKNFIIVSDITGFGLEKLILTLNSRKSGYVVVPDVLRPMNRKASFEQLTALLNILLEEGLRVIKRHNLDIELSSPLRFGFISAITDTEFIKVTEKFFSTGLLSRILVFSFYYNPTDVTKIQKQVALGKDSSMKIYGKTLEVSKISIPEKLVPYINFMSKFLDKNKYPFRNTKIIRKLAKASALLRGKTKISLEDLKNVYCFFPFITYADNIKGIDKTFGRGSDLHYLILKKVSKTKIEKPEDIKIEGYTEKEVSDVVNNLFARQLLRMTSEGLKLTMEVIK